MSTVQPTESVRDLSLSVSPRAPEGILLAESAAKRLAKLAEVEGKPVMLRVAVDGGGCSGFQYRFDLVDTVEADDLKVERDGATFRVDDISFGADEVGPPPGPCPVRLAHCSPSWRVR